MKARIQFHAILVMAVLFSLLPGRAKAATFCDAVLFVADVTVPDGTVLASGAVFTKTWRLKNNGTCTWASAYRLVFESGDSLGAPASLSLPAEVAPGQMMDFSVSMTAPTVAGHYRGNWKLKNAAGALFGIGSSANHAFWVDINVTQASSAAYNFASNAGYAEWVSGAGPLAFPGASGDARGYAALINTPRLEDGTTASAPGLLTVPQNKYNGYIQATYPEILIQNGDRFQTLVSCEYGVTACYVTFRVDTIVSGQKKTLWSWKEKLDGKYYSVDLNLSALAGKNVKFVLMVLATGAADGDRAIWSAPRIARGSGGFSPVPTFTPTITPVSAPPTVSAPGCDKAAFMADVTVPKGTTFAPGAAFTKTWRIKNTGTCTWTTGYSLTYYSGEQMGAPTSINLPWSVAPNQSVDLSLSMAAPPAAGMYMSNWLLRNAAGAWFGVNHAGYDSLWLQVQVAGSSPVVNGYDFAADVCSAQWSSGAGALPCPGVDNDSRGAALKLDAPVLENGSTATVPGLLTLPQNKYNGYIQGMFPTFTVQSGDRFKATLGCAYGANCYVTYRLDYMNAGGLTKVFWSWKEKNEGKTYEADVDLSPLAGQSVRFILTMLATGPATGDRALWGAPRITRIGASAPETPVPPTTAPPGEVTNVNVAVSPLPACTQSAPVNITGTISTNGSANVTYRWVTYLGAGETVSADSTLIFTDTGTKTVSYPSYPFNALCGNYVVVLAVTQPNAKTGQATFSLVSPVTPPPGDWLTFTNTKYNFQFKYPPGGEIISSDDAQAYIKLPFVTNPTGTNLTSKYLQLSLTENSGDCNTGGQTVVLNGMAFLKQAGQDRGAGNIHDFASYTTLKGNVCTKFLFVLRSGNPGNYSPTAIPYKFAAESATFEQILSTFAWLAPTPPPATVGPYAVWRVAPNDVLNIRSAAGVNNALVGSFPPDAINVMRTGAATQVDGGVWWEIQRPDGGLGWINSYYLTEYITRDAFCADTRLLPKIDQLKQAIAQSNGGVFSSLVSPSHGIFIANWSYGGGEDFTVAEVRGIFQDTASYSWGSGPSGVSETGTFAAVVQPRLAEVLNAPTLQILCDDDSKTGPVINRWAQKYNGTHYYELFKPGTPGVELDYSTWLAGFQYINGQPYLFALLRFTWEP